MLLHGLINLVLALIFVSKQVGLPSEETKQVFEELINSLALLDGIHKKPVESCFLL